MYWLFCHNIDKVLNVDLHRELNEIFFVSLWQILLWNNCNMFIVKNKMIELLLSRKQKTKYVFVSKLCESVNLFWSRYSDFSFMWKFIVTDVHKKRKRLRFRNHACCKYSWRQVRLSYIFETSNLWLNVLLVQMKRKENVLTRF